jgi:hypothetical protein
MSHPRKRIVAFRPQLESLEDRLAPAALFTLIAGQVDPFFGAGMTS